VLSQICAYDNGNAGINVVDSDHILVQDSELHRNGWNSEGDSGWGDGLTINNHKAVGRTSVVRRNIMYANWQKRPGSYWDGNGFTLDMAGDNGIHIVANNIFFNNGGTGLLAGDTGNLILVHNVFLRNMSDSRCRNTADLYLVQTGVHDSKLKNNIIYSRPDIWTIDRYIGDDDALIENNFIWGQDEKNTKIWWLDWKAVTMDYWILNRAPSTLHGDPGFVSAPHDKGFISYHNSEWIDMNIEDYDFRLAAYSQCIDQGGFLTETVSGGSGNRITVEDAYYFTDGFGIEGQGDVIKVGTNAPVIITEIDYDQNILVVDRSISWNRGDYVSFPYNGAAPDVGAFEFGEFIDEVDKDNQL
ncbi:right-handed parallel beta-helix repeat-containing protein, partial [bacterium]|nr:right-handed parallel beta-helix repeat-containing protein [bacterium]